MKNTVLDYIQAVIVGMSIGFTAVGTGIAAATVIKRFGSTGFAACALVLIAIAVLVTWLKERRGRG